MALFNNYSEQEEFNRNVDRDTLMSLNEKELLVEILLELQSINDQVRKIKVRQGFNRF